MIDNDSLTTLIRKRLPDACVEIVDRTGTMDHFNVTVTSGAFAGRSVLEQHQLVYGSLQEALADGRVHAVELKTVIHKGSASCPT
jgi:stress-induced morphogen